MAVFCFEISQVRTYLTSWSWHSSCLKNSNFSCFLSFRMSDGGLLLSWNDSSHTTYMKEEVDGLVPNRPRNIHAAPFWGNECLSTQRKTSLSENVKSNNELTTHTWRGLSYAGQHSLTSVERPLDTLWSLHKVDESTHSINPNPKKEPNQFRNSA